MRSHVWHAQQVNFHFFWLEKRITDGEAYMPIACAPSATMQYLVEREVQEIVRSVAYAVRPIVNATVLAVIVLLAAVPVCSLFLLLTLHAESKCYKMLSVHKLCQSLS
jgi:hypothetical protein